ncbi:MAG: ABC transporter substrate-binding protein [Anaerolineae bacterium]
MKRFALLLVLITLVVVAGCGPGGGAAESGPIKVGAIFDLTGPTSDVGTPYSNGMKDYVEWKNANGGINGRQIELISQDYNYKVDQAEQLYSQFVNQEKVVVFQGWGTGDTEALRGRIASDKVPFMSASYSANLIDIENAPYNFMIGTTYSAQLVAAIKWAEQDWAAQGNSGNPTVVVMHHDSPFGTSPLPEGEAYASSSGTSFNAIAMPGGATDLTAELTQADSAGANYIIVQNVPTPAALLAKNAASLGLEAKIICLNWCADELFVDLAGDAAEGVVGAIPFTPPSFEVAGMKDMAEFNKAKGTTLQAQGVRYVQGWLTMQVMAEGIKRVLDSGQELTGENVRAALEGISNYSTGDITAPLTFTPDNHAGNKALRMFEVQNGQWQPISDYIDVSDL